MRKKRTAHKNKKRPVRAKKATHRKRTAGRRGPVRGKGQVLEIAAVEPTGLGSNVAGQSGDIEGLSNVAVGNSESIAELVEEGQDLEAEVVSGVEGAPEPDEAEVTTHHRRNNYVPGQGGRKS